MVPEEGIVLDIGANLGVMTYYLAKSHPARSVFSFEPIPYNYENLLRLKNKFGLGNVKSFPIALGDRSGEIEMVLPVQNAVRFHGLAHVKEISADGIDKGELFRCPIQRLDEIEELKVEGIRLTGIKIDVENYEYFVLKGAESILKKHYPVIYCELWENENRVKTMQFLSTLGYKIFVLGDCSLILFNPQFHNTQNFFFVKELA
jgi:FkbM family methyltransferase